MLALTFGITSITMALIVAALANNDRKVIRFFTLFSVLFVNLAFLINHLKDGAHDGGPSAVGLTVVSLGLLAVVVGCVTGYQVAGPKTNAEHNTNNPPRQYAGRLLFWMAATILIPTWSYFYFLGFVPLFDAAVAVGRSGINGLGVLNESRLSRDAYVTGVGQRVPLQGLMEIYRNIGVPVLFALALDQIRDRKSTRSELKIVLQYLVLHQL